MSQKISQSLCAISVVAALFMFSGPTFAKKDKPVDPSKQSLGDLECTQNQIAKFDDTQNAWICAEDASGGSDGIVVYASNGNTLGRYLGFDRIDSAFWGVNVGDVGGIALMEHNNVPYALRYWNVPKGDLNLSEITFFETLLGYEVGDAACQGTAYAIEVPVLQSPEGITKDWIQSGFIVAFETSEGEEEYRYELWAPASESPAVNIALQYLSGKGGESPASGQECVDSGVADAYWAYPAVQVSSDVNSDYPAPFSIWLE